MKFCIFLSDISSVAIYILVVLLIFSVKWIVAMKNDSVYSDCGYKISCRTDKEFFMIHHPDIIVPSNFTNLICPGKEDIGRFSNDNVSSVNLCHMRNLQWLWCTIHGFLKIVHEIFDGWLA